MIESISWPYRQLVISLLYSDVINSVDSRFQVHVEFSDGGDVIKIEGPPDESEKAREILEAQAQELIKKMDFAEISVDAKYHKHIIGKGGSTGENTHFWLESTSLTYLLSPFSMMQF